ncbi:MAG: N-acetylglucosamine-6-phosphate deacetylase [Acidimicrobiia bacterium]|nr:N-acetylglucosamine-6-phosphate deacetylase [Acidimicrobiia bacterium]
MSRIVVAGRNRTATIENGLVVDESRSDGSIAEQSRGEFWLAPGFVDLQCNGIGGVDFACADLEGFRIAGTMLLATGVTSYLPTIVSAPLESYAAVLDRVAHAQVALAQQGLPAIEGVHLEGPFLGTAPGAHAPECLTMMDVDWLTSLLDQYPGLVRLVTLAPEADPDLEGTRALCDRGVVVALGHSRCSYDEAVQAAAAGATLVTHVFNAMSELHHRNPGLASAALDSVVPLTPTLIADLIHVHPSTVRLTMAAAPPILVTDRVATGVRYRDQLVVERDGAAFLQDGTLAGSVLTMDQAVRNLVGLGVSLEAAVKAATTAPADALGLGVFAASPGIGRADLVALDSETLEIRNVWISGELAYAQSY